MSTGRRTTASTVAALVVVLTGAAASWSYWGSGEGSGVGSAATGTVDALVASPAVPTTQVLPGAAAAVALTVVNPNPVELRLQSLTLDTSQGTGGFAVDPGHVGCAVSALSFADQANGGPGWVIPANGSSELDLPNALAMSLSAADACQGATFTVYLKAGS